MKFVLVFLACLGASLAAPKPYAVHSKVSLKQSPVSAKSIGQKSLLEDLLAVYDFLGWGTPPKAAEKIESRTLSDDLGEFLAILPLENLTKILNESINFNDDVCTVLKIWRKNTWKNFVDVVLAKPTAEDIIEYLKNDGIPVDDIRAGIREAIDADSATCGNTTNQNETLRTFLDSFEAELPWADMHAFLARKLQSSPEFQDLYTIMASIDGKALVEEVLEMDEATKFRKKLKGMGFNETIVLNAVYDFFGWGAPPKKDELNIFL